jgi:F0F1-type ATP synthase membrane subunit b/b'
MSTKTQGVTPTQSAVIKAYQDKISAQVQEAKAKLDLLDATARQKKAQAEIAAIASLNTAKQNIETRLKDLKATHESNASRARAEIDADVVKFKSSVDELAAKLKTHAATK